MHNLNIPVQVVSNPAEMMMFRGPWKVLDLASAGLSLTPEGVNGYPKIMHNLNAPGRIIFNSAELAQFPTGWVELDLASRGLTLKAT